MSKKVIFIGGTSRSGSTLLDMILANDLKGYSLGEVDALFRPHKGHHEKTRSYLMEHDQKWTEVIASGEDKLFETLFSVFPEIEFFVSSSKDPFWIQNQNQKVRQAGFDARNILIYKSPKELANSFLKRNQGIRWATAYQNYHRKYFTVVPEFRSVSYKSLFDDQEYLRHVCEYLGIEFFTTKHNYWEREQSTLFGSDTARYDSNRNPRKELRYDQPNYPSVEHIIDTVIKKRPLIEEIHRALMSCDVSSGDSCATKRLTYSSVVIALFRIKHMLRRGSAS